MEHMSRKKLRIASKCRRKSKDSLFYTGGREEGGGPKHRTQKQIQTQQCPQTAQGASHSENFKLDFKTNPTVRYLKLKYLKQKDRSFIVKTQNIFPKHLRGQCALLMLDEIIFKVKTTKNKENHYKEIARRTFPHIQKYTDSKTRCTT